jgi:class 3 adenylate cyclase
MKQINLRLCILLCIFSLTIIPVLLINIFYVSTVVREAKEQNETFYCDLVNQLAINIDYYYSQYAEAFGNISTFPSFQKILNRPRMSALDEKSFLHYSQTSAELREGVSAKNLGDFFLVEFIRKNKADSPTCNLIDFSEKLSVDINLEKMQKEPALALVKKELDGKPVLCEAEILKSNSSEKYLNRTFIFYPYQKNNERELKYLMGIMCNEDFFYKMYKDNSGIERGTVYLQDQFGKLLNVNHPSPNDCYKYDYLSGKYLYANEHIEQNARHKMTLKEYQLLNTDSQILQVPQFLYQREKFNKDDSVSPTCSVVMHKQQKFMAIFMKAPLSQVEISYFYPLVLVYMPVIGIVVANLILMALLLIIMSLVIIKVTNRLMLPMTQLINAQREIERGNYDTRLDENIFFGEFADIGKNFNAIVSKKTEERAEFNVLIEEQQRQISNNSKELEFAAKRIRNEYSMREVNLQKILPKSEVGKILADEKIEPTVHDNVCVFLLKINEFSNSVSNSATVEQFSKLNELFIKFDEIMDKYGCYKIRTLGQSYLATCGIAVKDSWCIQHLTAAAIECMSLIEKENSNNENQIKFKASLCYGNVTAGVIGDGKFVYDVVGKPINCVLDFIEQTPDGRLSLSSEMYQTLRNDRFWKFVRFKEVILKNGKIEEMFLFNGESNEK